MKAWAILVEPNEDPTYIAGTYVRREDAVRALVEETRIWARYDIVDFAQYAERTLLDEVFARDAEGLVHENVDWEVALYAALYRARLPRVVSKDLVSIALVETEVR